MLLSSTEMRYMHAMNLEGILHGGIHHIRLMGLIHVGAGQVVRGGERRGGKSVQRAGLPAKLR